MTIVNIILTNYRRPYKSELQKLNLDKLDIMCLRKIVCALSFKGLRTNFILLPHSKNWSKFGKCSEMFACLLGVHRLAVFCAADG